VFLPWFKAQVTIQSADGTVTGTLFDPPGYMAGLTAHACLLVPLTAGLLQSAVIAARYFPSRSAPRLQPGAPLLPHDSQCGPTPAVPRNTRTVSYGMCRRCWHHPGLKMSNLLARDAEFRELDAGEPLAAGPLTA